ncbi:MAG: NAD(P)/FAD-dependent oxidoreductase [Betaproteobacteria bacterium]|nr:MAG: NAD(P)/FAD-dependent oxidoreductase [Betaproteobacteria bacterium]
MRYDAVIVGGGHNGLVCVLERRAMVGGAAVTEEFAPGFRNSTAAYTVSLLNPKVIRDLRLAEHGLKIVERPFANFLPLPDNRSFRLGPTLADTQRELARFSARDAERLPDYYRVIETAADALRRLALETPPNLGGGWRDWLRALSLGRRLARLARSEQRNLWELVTRSAGELLDYWFESDPIKAVFGFDAQVGHFASPYSPGSAYVLLHHAFGEVNGKRGSWGHALGGMGAISEAMAKEARERGVEITTGAEVIAVRVKGGRVSGVALRDGTEIEAGAVAGAVNPKLLYLRMLEPGALDADFRSRIERWKCASGSFRMNVALAELPDFACAPGKNAQPHHSSGVIIAPSLAYMERAYFDARTAGFSRDPIVEMLIPSTVDPSLAPPGKHVASLFCQHFDPVLPGEESWDDAREAAADAIVETVNRHAPNFKASILARKVLSPLDLEREFGMIGGDIFHGALTLDQLFSARPVLGYADYRSPVRGLYLCGSGAHPGGGVTGAPGHNAAREILRDFRRR